MRKVKANQQTTIVFVVVNPPKKSEPPVSWEDVVAFASSVEAPLSVLWPHRRVRKGRAFKAWQRYAATLHRFVLYAKSDLPISSAMWTTFHETKRAEKQARYKILEHRHS